MTNAPAARGFAKKPAALAIGAAAALAIGVAPAVAASAATRKTGYARIYNSGHRASCFEVPTGGSAPDFADIRLSNGLLANDTMNSFHVNHHC
ncbi:hypothetical protein ACNTMW_23205 [Planosporangium sp. 12N6]|uniref:hypothetical protein n=1 Tax=Planosporangium spinosum TaxID=3402278 RepID=UPI003CED1FE8